MKQQLTALLMLASLLAAGQGQGRLGVQRYGHVVLPVRSLAISIPFYNNVLSLKPVAVPSGVASSQAWFEVGGGQQIRLVEGRPENSRPSGTTLALVVNSLRQTEQQLRQRGVAVSRQNVATGRGNLYVSDPDGYVYEFNEGKSEGPGFLQSAAKSIWRSMTEVE